MADTTVELNLDKLHKFVKAAKLRPPVVKVGVLGKNSRTGDAATNATIGAAHEFGTSTAPQRSFLRVPIAEHLASNLENAGAFSEDVAKQVLKQGTLSPWMEKVAIEAVGVVMEAFDTSGFGRWEALKPQTMERKKVKQILVETQQLRNSITYEIS